MDSWRSDDVAEQVIGHRVAGERVAEAQRAARRRHVHELVPHRHHEIGARLEGVPAADPRDRVEELELVRVLELRQEVGRADAAQAGPAEVAVDRDAWQASGDDRIGDRARDRRGARRLDAERLLHGVGFRARVRQPELVDHRGRQDAGPPADDRVGLDGLVAERRRPGAVHDAAEGAGDLALAVRIDVAGEDAVVGAGVPVGAAEQPIGVVQEIAAPEEVVGARLIRQRHQVEDRRGVGVDAVRRNGVVVERLSRHRIADRGRENAGPVVEGRHARQARHAAGDPRAFVVGEEERPSLDHRAAQVAAELVLVVGRLRRVGALREEVDGVERLVAEVLVGGAVEVVRAGLRRDADRGARRASVLGRVRAGHHLEFLDRVDRRPRDLGRQLLHVLGDGVVVDAVEEEVVLERSRAVHVDAAGAPERRAAALLGVAVALHARHQRQQVVPVPDRERQVGDLHLRDHRAQRRVVSVQQRRGLGNRDRFRELSHRQLDVEARALPDLERYDLCALLEAGQLDVDPVSAGDEVVDLVAAGLSGDLPRLDVGGKVGHDHRRAWHGGASRVPHDAAQCGAIDLRPRRSGVEQEQSAECQKAVSSRHESPPQGFE